VLDQFYGDGLSPAIGWRHRRRPAEAAQHPPEGRRLGILAVVGASDGLAAQVLPMLERGVHTYTFSDVSAGFFPGAMQKLAAFPEVETKIFDLEKPGAEQGFEAGEFDLVIGTNVLHAVSDVRVALAHLHGLLAPGGSLVFMDTATPQLWTETVFGLTSGWWRFTDRELRPHQPLLERKAWDHVLREAGFSETASLPGLIGPTGGEGQIGLLARKAWQPSPVLESVVEIPVEKSWLVFADESGLGDQLAARLRAAGARCRVARRGERFASADRDMVTLRAESPDDWKQLLQTFADEAPLERIVYLWNVDAPLEVAADDAIMGTDALLHLTQALETAMPMSKLRIDSVTRGAQPVGRGPVATAVAQAPAVGLMRVILNEHPNFFCRGVDLPPLPSDADVSLIWSELLRADPEREIAFRGEARYVQRLARGRSSIEETLDPAVPLRLGSRERGHLDTLRFVPFTVPPCGPGEVLIDVKAAGMNFRDVLKELALYPSEAADARVFMMKWAAR
jgi:SAM-dependent methyltransferase